jgi:hypothetical protein
MTYSSPLAALENERDEWRKRAEAAARPRTTTEYVVRRGPFGARLLAALWLVVPGLLVGGAAIPMRMTLRRFARTTRHASRQREESSRRRATRTRSW